MSQDENDIDQSDEVCTFMLDIKLQENLFEVGESFLLEDFLQSSAANANNNAKQDKCNKFDIRYAELTGWCNKTKYNFRKLEKDNKPLTKEMTKTDIREDYFGYHYKDTRLKRPESYKFRHFSDIKKYICQYRNDHSFTSNVRKPSLPTETGVKHAFQSRQSVGTPNKDSLKETTSRVPDATQTSNGTPTNACLHYTTRKETKPALQELAYKYKLAPNVVLFNENNSNSPEHEKIVTQLRSQSAFCKSPRILSGKLPQNKLTCKMSTPLNQPNMTTKTPPLKTLTVSGYSSPKPGDVTAVRTVDQLTCITAGDRQGQEVLDDQLKQRLELLRQVNKPQEKEKEKLTRLMFLRDGDMAQKLCDQRRLKHLIEQAKLKRFRPSADFFSLPTKTPHGTVNTIDIDDVTSKPNSCSPRSTISSLSEGNVFEDSAKSVQGSFQDVCVGDCEWTKITQNTPVPLIAD